MKHIKTCKADCWLVKSLLEWQQGKCHRYSAAVVPPCMWGKKEGEHLCGGLQAARPRNYLVTCGVIKFLWKIPVSMTSKSNGEWEMREKKNPHKKVPRVEEMRRWQLVLPGGAKLDHPTVAAGHFIHPLFSHDWQNKSQLDASRDCGWICLCFFSHEDTNTRQQFVMWYEHSEPLG